MKRGGPFFDGHRKGKKSDEKHRRDQKKRTLEESQAMVNCASIQCAGEERKKKRDGGGGGSRKRGAAVKQQKNRKFSSQGKNNRLALLGPG